MRFQKKQKKNKKKASAPGIAIFCELSSDLKEKKKSSPEKPQFSPSFLTTSEGKQGDRANKTFFKPNIQFPKYSVAHRKMLLWPTG